MIEMMKIKIKKGYNCRNVDFDNGEYEFEVEKFDLVEVMSKVLIEYWGSEKECCGWWNSFSKKNYGKVEEVVKGEVFEMMKWDKDNKYWEGELMISEEGYCKIFVDGKLFLG